MEYNPLLLIVEGCYKKNIDNKQPRHNFTTLIDTITLRQWEVVKILGFWLNCGLETSLPLRHGWGSQPPQIASCIHIRHIHSVWAHWYAVHGHTVAALHSYTPTLLSSDFGVRGNLWSQKWCHFYVMVEAEATSNSFLPCIHIRHIQIQSVWAYWSDVHQHTVAAFNSYTHTT